MDNKEINQKFERFQAQFDQSKALVNKLNGDVIALKEQMKTLNKRVFTLQGKQNGEAS